MKTIFVKGKIPSHMVKMSEAKKRDIAAQNKGSIRGKYKENRPHHLDEDGPVLLSREPSRQELKRKKISNRLEDLHPDLFRK